MSTNNNSPLDNAKLKLIAATLLAFIAVFAVFALTLITGCTERTESERTEAGATSETSVHTGDTPVYTPGKWLEYTVEWKFAASGDCADNTVSAITVIIEDVTVGDKLTYTALCTDRELSVDIPRNTPIRITVSGPVDSILDRVVYFADQYEGAIPEDEDARLFALTYSTQQN